MSNYSPLQLNTLAGFSEPAQCLYFKLLDVFQGYNNKQNEQKAFLAADRFENRCARVVDYIIHNSPVHDLNDDTINELSLFISERWRHNFM